MMMINDFRVNKVSKELKQHQDTLETTELPVELLPSCRPPAACVKVEGRLLPSRLPSDSMFSSCTMLLTRLSLSVPTPRSLSGLPRCSQASAPVSPRIPRMGGCLHATQPPCGSESHTVVVLMLWISHDASVTCYFHFLFALLKTTQKQSLMWFSEFCS